MSKTRLTNLFGSNVQPKRRVREQADWTCDVCDRHVKKHWAVCPYCGEGSAY